jgi:protein TonB
MAGTIAYPIVSKAESGVAPPALSILAHAALIAAWILATGRPVSFVKESRSDTTLVWVAAPSSQRNTPRSSLVGNRAPPVTWPVPQVDAPDIPGLYIPIPGPPGPLVHDTGFGGWMPSGGDTTSGGSPGLVPAFDSRVVEEPPVLLEHPRPRFPELLRQAGLEGRVLIEAVVDTLGRVERSTVRVIESAHPLFEAEARAVVLGSRYRPARSGTRAVRVRIIVPVVFGIRR